jgi:cell wall-associated NlpC family hydrolase
MFANKMKSAWQQLVLLVLALLSVFSVGLADPDPTPVHHHRHHSPTPTPTPTPTKTPTPTLTPTPTPRPSGEPTPVSSVATLAPDELRDFATFPEPIQRLITSSLSLTRLNLSYKYGSCDPKEGGMDCSGTVYYVLTHAGVTDVPRDSSEMYVWVWKESRFNAVLSLSDRTFELDRLKPGDLLFWTGTYNIERDPPVTHVMIYLGINRKTGSRVMFGASEGRRFDGKACYGVSVFDFKIPSGKAVDAEKQPGARFVGYGPVPRLQAADAPLNKTPVSTPTKRSDDSESGKK